MHEARLEDSGSGLAPATDGWFVVNVRDAMWLTSETPGPLQPSGAECSFESPFAEFAELGIRLHVLPPGEPNGLGHTESQQEAFLVLSGRGTSSTARPAPRSRRASPRASRRPPRIRMRRIAAASSRRAVAP